MTTLRMMSWNVQNLFEAGAADGPPSQAAFDAKVAALAAAVNEYEPHVLALQEVGSETALTALQSALDPTMRYRLVAGPDPRGIRVALLSVRVLRNRVDVSTFPPELLPTQTGDDPPGPTGPPTMNQLGRPALQATIRAGNRDVTVLVCHLKSKLLTYPGGRFFPRDEGERARFTAYAMNRRIGEATTLRCHLNDVLAGQGHSRAVILAGDLNDEPHAATTQLLQGPPGSEIGTAGYHRPDAGDKDRMWNLAALLPQNEAFSRRYRDRGELIDHILVSHHLVGRAVEVHTVTATAHLPSIGDDPSDVADLPGSDHAAVTATFDLTD